MEKISTFKFGNIQERDMDLLFMESIATDREFVRLFLDKAAEKYDSFDVLSVASVDKGIHNKTTKYGLPTY